jgi:cation-transporting P-type ATPase C
MPALRDDARAAAAEHALVAADGVRGVRTYARTGSVVVWFDQRRVPMEQLSAALVEACDQVADPAARRTAPASRGGEITRLAVGGGVLALLALRKLVLRRPRLLGGGGSVAATTVTIFTGYPFFRGAARSLLGRQAGGTDALVTAATVASLLLRENVVALTVLWLLNVGEFLAELTLRRTRRAIRDLIALAEDRVWLVGEDGEVEARLRDLRVGDRVAVYTHAKIPVDGEVVAGEALVDQAAVTGESMPVHADTGDEVYAGTVVVQGALTVLAARVGSDTAVGRIVQRVEAAQADRAPIQTLADRFSRRFVPFSFALAAGTYLVTCDARRNMTMLLVACPCAAGLSTPTAMSASIGNGARRGTLIKGGTYLEGAGRVNAVVFDKTGTLTVGRPLVTNVVALTDEHAPEQVLSLAASSEIHARHPLGQALIRHTEEQHIEIPVHEQCEVLIGLGMRADLQGNRLLVGSRRLMQTSGVPVDDQAAEWIGRFAGQGEIVICVAYNSRLIGVVGITDVLREDSLEVVQSLRALGVGRIVMITGDTPRTARAAAQSLDIDDYYAEALSETKVEVVQALQAAGHVVAVVGDGANDAPALALADIGIAMGASGTDVAIETADITLAGDLRELVASVITLGRRTLRVVRQNYGLAIGVNTVGLLVSALGTLSPVLAAVLHNASSVAVVLNSSRPARYDPTAPPRTPMR